MSEVRNKTISFTKEYRDVYDYLDSLDNASRYVCRLVKADMTGENLDDRIRRIISEYQMQPKQPEQEHTQIDDAILNAVQNLYK